MAFQYELNKGYPLKSTVTVDDQFHRTYKQYWMIITEREASPFNAGTADEFPLYGTSYVWIDGFRDLWAFARNFEIAHQGEVRDPIDGTTIRTKWMVTITFTSKPSSGSNDNQTGRDNPLNDPPIISGSFSSFSRIATRDKDGEPIVNSADFPYDPEVETDDAYDTLRISYNTARLNLGQRASMINTVNSAPIWGLAKRQAKLKQWDYEVLWAGRNFSYIKHNFSFEISWQQAATKDVHIGAEFKGKRGYYTTLPDSGEIYWVDGKPEKGADEKEIKKKKEKFSAKDEGTFQLGKLKANGDKLPETDPQPWNIYTVEAEMDFRSIPNMPNPLPGPF